MGNVLAQPKVLQPEPVSDLPNVVLKDTLGRGRFLKTLLCLHDEGGLVVVKAYHKRADSPSLGPYKQQLARLRASLHGLPCPHVWPWQSWVETASAGYLMRQHLASGLNDRLSTRPFLTHAQKKWIAFQLLHAVAQSHEAGCCHGDIKTENVLLTSWSWVFLSDYAPYKPTFLPADNPAEFSFYFDTGGRRRCYIAPERFFSTAASPSSGNPLATAATAPIPSTATKGSLAAAPSAGATPSKLTPGGGSGALPSAGSGTGRADSGVFVRGMSMELGGGSRPLGPLTPAMDVFSLGCTIAELFLDGRTVIDLGQLLGYSRGEWDPAVQGLLSLLEPELRQMVLHMIQRNPASRWQAQDYLEHWGPKLFPSYFEKVLHPFFDSLLPMDADARIAAVQSALPLIKAAMLQEPVPPTPAVTRQHTPAGELRAHATTPHSLPQHPQHPQQQQQQQLGQETEQPAGTCAELVGAAGAGSSGRPEQGHAKMPGGGGRAHSGEGRGAGALRDVGALLDDAAHLMHAMQGQHQRSSSGDALMFMLDEAEAEPGASTRRHDEGGGQEGRSGVESVTDMCYEWQFRDPAGAAGGDGSWAPASPGSSPVRHALCASIPAAAAAAAAAAGREGGGAQDGPGPSAPADLATGSRRSHPAALMPLPDPAAATCTPSSFVLPLPTADADADAAAAADTAAAAAAAAAAGGQAPPARRHSRRQLHPFRSKEGMGLPAEGGWAWEDTSWQLVGPPGGVGGLQGGAGTEEVGWEYCQQSAAEVACRGAGAGAGAGAAGMSCSGAWRASPAATPAAGCGSAGGCGTAVRRAHPPLEAHTRRLHRQAAGRPPTRAARTVGSGAWARRCRTQSAACAARRPPRSPWQPPT